MYEPKYEALIPRAEFLLRMARHTLLSAAIISVSLLFGIVGYRATEGMAWVDAFLNACMLMGGMGPVGDLHHGAAKVFAGCYALYCGLVVIAAMGVVIAPAAHRFLHLFHQEPPGGRDDG